MLPEDERMRSKQVEVNNVLTTSVRLLTVVCSDWRKTGTNVFGALWLEL
jgi:hypothetical protein